MRIDITQMLLLMALFGLISGLAVSVSVKPPAETPAAIRVSPNGELLAVASVNRRVSIYRLESDELPFRVRRVAKSSSIFDSFSKTEMEFVDDEQITVLSSTQWDTSQVSVQRWDLRKNEIEEIEKSGMASPVELFIGGKYLLKSNSSTDTVVIEDLQAPKKGVRTLEKLDFEFDTNPFAGNNSGLQISDDGKVLLAVESSGFNTGVNTNSNVTLMDENGKEISGSKFDLEYNSRVMLSPKGNFVARCNYSGNINIYDQKLQPIANMYCPASQLRTGRTFCFSPDENKFAALTDEGKAIEIYDMPSGDLVSRIELPTFWDRHGLFNIGHTQMVFSNASDQLIVVQGTTDHGIQIFDVSSGQKVRHFGRVYRFMPGLFFGFGFIVWAGVWGMFARRRIASKTLPPAYAQEDVEFDADTIRPEDIVEAEIAEEAKPPKIPNADPVMIGYDPDRNPETPAGVKVAWVVMALGGIWGIMGACVVAFQLSPTSIFELSFIVNLMFGIAIAFVLMTSVMALARGIGRYTSRMMLVSVLQVTTILCCDFVNFSLGLTALLCCTVGNGAFFVVPGKPRIGSFRSKKTESNSA